MAKVRFENVSFSYGDKKIIDNLSLDVEDGEIMGVIGPSGCGKTTLIRMLCGFIKPETGAIHIGDMCVFDAKKKINVPPERRNIGVVFQDYAVWPHLTVLENVMYPLKKRKVPKEERIKMGEAALAQVQMSEYAKHLPSQLSGGQQQRVAIARALVSSSELIVLDEPITNLDLKLREAMLEEIRQIQETIGTTIIYISHDQEASLQLCDHLAIMDNQGYLRQIGNDIDIVMNPIDRFVFKFIGISNFIPVEIKNDSIMIETKNGSVKISDVDDSIEKGQAYELAVRPMDIVFDDESECVATVKSVTFLGNVTNYFVELGDQIIRVQQSALDVLQNGYYDENETVGLKFMKEFYYESEAN
ncbi:ABC transporter ATP-binding protein [Erysipelothrix urinaevulpis]|uniref:ABC transporter ATP-binding protein n=1 Tax=Erysipelothrix urinaevulpis TaxID=2683717 RepID=UPI001359E42A|nr:ABC transporter ATP-binding protein [Erysipelothrix urinaevulpis]